MLSKDRDIIITDFGFANRFLVAQQDLMATSCGSPCYAAPELVINDESNYVGTAVDIWSCGVILFAMLCGYLPFDDDPTNPQGANINVLYKYIVSTPLEIPNHMSIEATDLLRQMLVPDPTKRCNMDQIRQHPWLKEYADLLNLDQIEHMTADSDPRSVHKPPITTILPSLYTTTTTTTTATEPESRDPPSSSNCTTPNTSISEKVKQDDSTEEENDTVSSFLQEKFYSTLVSHTPQPPSTTNTTTTFYNKIPNRSHSVQQQSSTSRRERTTSENYTSNRTHHQNNKQLNILPSVSEQTTVIENNNRVNRTKGQKLMDWFKRKPSQSKKRKKKPYF